MHSNKVTEWASLLMPSLDLVTSFLTFRFTVVCDTRFQLSTGGRFPCDLLNEANAMPGCSSALATVGVMPNRSMYDPSDLEGF
jgi:hypothetical protein